MKVHFLEVDGGFGLYVRGTLVAHGYELHPMDLLKYAEKHDFYFSDVWHDYHEYDGVQNVVIDNGTFPEKLSDLPGY